MTDMTYNNFLATLRQPPVAVGKCQENTTIAAPAATVVTPFSGLRSNFEAAEITRCA